jgi:hypothetical protein
VLGPFGGVVRRGVAYGEEGGQPQLECAALTALGGGSRRVTGDSRRGLPASAGLSLKASCITLSSAISVRPNFVWVWALMELAAA